MRAGNFTASHLTPFKNNTFMILQKILSFNWSGKHAPRVAQHCLFNWIHKWHCECHKFWQIAEATWKNWGENLFLRKQPLRLKRREEFWRSRMEAWMEAIGTDLDLRRDLSRQELGQCEALSLSPSLSGLLEHAQQPNAHERNYV